MINDNISCRSDKSLSAIFLLFFLTAAFSAQVNASPDTDESATNNKSSKFSNKRSYYTTPEQYTEEYTVYKPRQFVRRFGQPLVERDTFEAPSASDTYVIKIYPDNQYQHKDEDQNSNNNNQVGHPPTSAVITLNGVEILSSNEVIHQVSLIRKVVRLLPVNELTVEVRGRHQSAIVVEIIGVGSIPSATISVGKTPQTSTSEGLNTDVPVSLDILLLYSE